jgi:predicted nucleotidyltransferase
MKPIYIKKEVAIKKVSTKYKPILKDVKFELLKFSNKIHSIYLYGSVATGKAKSPTSDLDLVVVLKAKPTPKLKAQIKELELSLSKKYQDVFREVGFAVTYKNEILRGKESYGWKFFLKVLSVKIFGDNLFQKDTKFSPTKLLARNLHSDVYKNIEEAKRKIKSSNSQEAKLQIKSIMKKIIKTAFSIVMENENYWTTDLDEMTKIFIKHYPEKKQQINAVLVMAKSKTPDKKSATLILNNFGKWISSEFYKRT